MDIYTLTIILVFLVLIVVLSVIAYFTQNKISNVDKKVVDLNKTFLSKQQYDSDKEKINQEETKLQKIVKETLNNSFDGKYSSLKEKPVLFDGDYEKLKNKPNLNKDGYGDYEKLKNKPDLFNGHYDNLTNKPVLFDGKYNSLINRPLLFDGSWSNLTNVPDRFPTKWDMIDGKPVLNSWNNI